MNKGEWKAQKQELAYNIMDEGKCIATVHAGNAEANTILICEAVNACKAVNPDNPLKVAQSIKDLVKGCELGLKIAEDIIHDEYDGTSMLDRLLSQLEPIRQALANIGGK